MSETETDQEPGAEHPRRTHTLFGHLAAEATLAEALSGGRAHHAWMLTGPKGVGKATLAYRAARVVLGARRSGPRPLDVSPTDVVARRVDQLAHPDLFVLRRGRNEKGKPRREISVDDARGLGAFFALQPAEGGWRVAVIDAVDDLNRNAANALLKVLEEPPERAIILLIAHAPGAVLPTIRSRVRRLALRALDEAGMREALSGTLDPKSIQSAMTLAEGRPGRALALVALKAHELEGGLDEGLDLAVRGRPSALLRMSSVCSGAQADAKAGVLIGLMRRAAWRGARCGVGLDAAAQAWLTHCARTERAAKMAAAHVEIGALESALQGLDMDPALAVSRASAILIEALA